MADDKALNGADPAPVIDPEVPPTDKPPVTEPPVDEAKTLLSDGEDKGAPEKYADFTVPKGIEIDKPLLEAAMPVLKELGLSQAKAQKLVDMFAARQQAADKALNDSFTNEMTQWQTKAKADKEFGGDTFDANLGKAKSAIDKFGTPELKKLLNETGIGNHPEIVRFAFRVGKLIAEDNPGGDVKAPLAEQDMATRWYSNESQRTN
jgi:hypothetical protein